MNTKLTTMLSYNHKTYVANLFSHLCEENVSFLLSSYFFPFIQEKT